MYALSVCTGVKSYLQIVPNNLIAYQLSRPTSLPLLLIMTTPVLEVHDVTCEISLGQPLFHGVSFSVNEGVLNEMTPSGLIPYRQAIRSFFKERVALGRQLCSSVLHILYSIKAMYYIVGGKN